MAGNKKYHLNSEIITIDGKSFVSYGITGENSMMKDISFDKNKVEKMIEEMNSAELEECHFLDYIIDSVTREALN